MRLNKYLATAGIASRRKSEELIVVGKVRVNGDVVTDPARDVSETDAIEVSGKPVVNDDLETYVLNKPLGAISTASDEKGRDTVVDLIQTEARLYPVGRLDADSTGLILLTNDGELANRLTHPKYEVPKTYRAELKGRITDEAVAQLRGGVKLKDGRTAPAKVVVKKSSKSGSTIEITIHEGKNRQIRRMAEAVGFPVVRLERIVFGPLQLGRLKPGQSRKLRASELAILREPNH